MRIDICDTLVEVSKTELSILVCTHTVDRPKNTQHQTIAISATYLSDPFVVKTKAG